MFVPVAGSDTGPTDVVAGSADVDVDVTAPTISAPDDPDPDPDPDEPLLAVAAPFTIVIG